MSTYDELGVRMYTPPGLTFLNLNVLFLIHKKQFIKKKQSSEHCSSQPHKFSRTKQMQKNTNKMLHIANLKVY